MIPDNSSPRPKNIFLPEAQYDGRATVSVEQACEDDFAQLTPPPFVRKVALGDTELPVTQGERSQESHKYVHINDLADYIDRHLDTTLRIHNMLHRK